MSYNIYDLKQYYQSPSGGLIRRLLVKHIRGLWPDVHGQRVMGTGYAVPFLRSFMNDAERVFSVMPQKLGVHGWPETEACLTCLADETEIPLETESVDRILMVHGLEHAEHPNEYFKEAWRVMKSNGRLLVVVPNRLGLWARADWTPFGHGTPYTHGQLNHMLQHNLFHVERNDRALFMPPFKSSFVLRSAYRIEKIGQYMMPGLAGVYIIEAGKQVYGGVSSHATAKGRKRVMVVDPVPT